MRIIDLINERNEQNRPFYSFQYFPPKTEQATANLKSRVERMVRELDPLFVDVTWGAGGTTSEATLDISSWIQAFSGTQVMMHLTLTNMRTQQIDAALQSAKEKKMHNILALRGDPPRGEDTWYPQEGGLRYGTDLVRYIREKHGDYFGITVAGYPEGHIDCESKPADLQHLKEKVDAGADFIITQLFYDTDEFLNFVQICREAGIQCPIIPGIMPIQSYGGFHRMTSFCKTKVPQHIYDDLEPIKNDDAKVKQYGIQLGIQMCKKLMEHGINGFHFYTLNLERVVKKILEGLEIIQVDREAPWRKVATRKEEEIRPVHWNQRPKAYIERTLYWDQYPNGRWGDSRSPAFGYQYPLHHRESIISDKQKQSLKQIWGEPVSEKEVAQVFEKVVNGEIDKFPWNEEPLDATIEPLKELLVLMNQNLMLTITSQPQINGLSSSDSVFGWGSKDGYIYSRAYVEFFCPNKYIPTMVEIFAKFPSIAFVVTNHDGSQIEGNMPEGTVIALTWGMFPNKEILQPTIVDRELFLNWWRQEAFQVWKYEWACIYEDGSESAELIKRIHDSYCLVTVVENDYVGGNMMTPFQELVAKIQTLEGQA